MVEVHPLAFDRPQALTDSLRGASVLYNTYWVRFNHKAFSRAQAVANTLVLLEAAKRAGVGRVVQLLRTAVIQGARGVPHHPRPGEHA